MTNDGKGRTVRMVEHYWMPLADGEIQVRTARKSVSLKGGSVKEILPHVLPLLDGSRTEEDIVTALQGKVEPSKARGVLKALRDRGLLEDLEPPPPSIPAEDAPEYETIFRYYQGQVGQRYSIVDALRGARIVLAGAGPLTASLVAGLAHCGAGTLEIMGSAEVTAADLGSATFFRAEDVGRPRAQVIAERFDPSKKLVSLRHELDLPASPDAWAKRIAGASLVVAEVSGPAIFHPWLLDLNEGVIAAGVRWMPLALLGNTAAQIGPTVVPEMTPCLGCFRKHFDAQSAFLESFEPFARLKEQIREAPLLPTFADLAANMAVIEAIRATTPGQDALTYGRVATLRFEDLSTKFHVVPKQPRCPACGPARQSPRLRIWS